MKDVICANPNCGYHGQPERRARGNLLLGILLLCVFILPGVVYLLCTSGYIYTCPRCHQRMSL